jgi:adenylate cyclase
MSDIADVCSEVAVRTELQRILNSSNFTASDRNRRFLGYIVDETLAGRAGRLKAYNVATTVFGRPDSFDPHDPVVRMEAGRLRRALERFYLLEGHTGTIAIAMPKGGYVPEFRAVGPQSAMGEHAQAASGQDTVTILVAPFDSEGDPSATLNLNVGFTRHVMICLHQLGDCVVCRQQLSVGDTSKPARYPIAANGELVLVGDLAVVAGYLNVTALLLKAPEGRVQWGDTFRREVQRDQSIFALRDAVAECVAKSLHDYLARAFATPRPADCPAAPSRPTWSDPIEQTDHDHGVPNNPMIATLQYGGPVPTH